MSRPRTRQTHQAATLAIASDLRVLVGQLRRRLREHSRTDALSEPQRAVVLHLHKHGPTTVTALAHAEGVRPQSMGATVASLVTAGLLVGTPHPSDGRQTLLALTQECERLLEASRAAKEDWLAGLMGGRLSKEEQQELARGIALINRLLAP